MKNEITKQDAKPVKNRQECAILTRLADESPDGLQAQIVQMTGDPMFTRKFVQCVKNAVTSAWRQRNGVWENPFQIVPLNSVLDCLWECANRHILPDGYNAYLVCYCGKNPSCQLLVDYKGMIDTAIKEGIVDDANADVVCENDTFVWDCGEVSKWTFDFRKPRGKVVGACAWAILPNGRKKWMYVPLDELQKIRACVRDTGIWDKWTNEMYKKSAIRRLFKTTRNTPNMNSIMEMDNRNYDLDAPDNRRYVSDKTPVRSVIEAQGAKSISLTETAEPQRDDEPQLEPVPVEANAEADIELQEELF